MSVRELLVELLDGVSRSHNAKTIAAAAHRVLSRHWAAESLNIAVGEIRVTAGVGANGNRVTLRLEDIGGSSGTAAIVARSRRAPTDDERAVVSSVLAAALRQEVVLDRVASLSRRAHVRSRELDQNLRELVLPPSIVATSPAMRRIFAEVVPLVARQPTTVLDRRDRHGQGARGPLVSKIKRLGMMRGEATRGPRDRASSRDR